jgi:hypothetical protein
MPRIGKRASTNRFVAEMCRENYHTFLTDWLNMSRVNYLLKESSHVHRKDSEKVLEASG